MLTNVTFRNCTAPEPVTGSIAHVGKRRRDNMAAVVVATDVTSSILHVVTDFLKAGVCNMLRYSFTMIHVWNYTHIHDG